MFAAANLLISSAFARISDLWCMVQVGAGREAAGATSLSHRGRYSAAACSPAGSWPSSLPSPLAPSSRSASAQMQATTVASCPSPRHEYAFSRVGRSGSPSSDRRAATAQRSLASPMAIGGDLAQSPVSTGRPQCRGKYLRAPQASAMPRLCGVAPEQSLHGERRSAGRRSCSAFPAPGRWPTHFARSSSAPTIQPSVLP